MRFDMSAAGLERVLGDIVFAEAAMNEDVASSSTGWRTLLIAGAIAGAVPFMASYSQTSTTVVNGVASSTFRDWVAVGAGGLAIVLALAAIASLAKSKRMKEIAMGVAVLALGGYQVARGFGVFDSTTTSVDVGPPMPTMPTTPRVADDPATCPDGDACDTVAYHLKDKDPKGALVARIRSCTEFKHKYACEEAAQLYASGKVGEPDIKKALELAEKACDLGNGDSCAHAGVELFQGKSVPKDIPRAITFMEKGCKDGNLVACKNLAVIHQQGLEGVTVDLEKAFEFGTRACGDGRFDQGEESDVAAGCSIAGELALEGKGTTKDGKRAIELFTTACQRAADHCFDLARAHETGQGGLEKDPKTAREIYTRGCDAKNLASCNNLAGLLDDGLGGPKDKAAAQKLFKEACDGGFEHSCKFVKKK